MAWFVLIKLYLQGFSELEVAVWIIFGAILLTAAGLLWRLAVRRKVEKEMARIPARSKLSEQVRMNRKFLEATGDCFLMGDRESKVIEVNRAYWELMGYRKKELLSMKISDLVPEEDRDDLKERVARAHKEGSINVTVRHKKKDGEIKEFDATLVSMTFENQTYLGGFLRDITDKKEAERKLEESEQRFKLFFKNNSQAVFHMDQNGNLVDVNDKAVQLSGFTRKELLGMNFDYFVSDKDKEKATGHFQKVLSGQPDEVEVTSYDKNRQRLELYVKSFPMLVRGKVEGVYGVAQDITAEKDSKRKLEESEQRWQQLVYNSPQSILISHDGKVEFINPAGARVLGHKTPDEAIGNVLLEYVHPESREMVKERIERSLDITEPLEPVTHRIVRANGETGHVEVHSVPIFYKGKKSIQTVFYDITRLKEQERLLKESEERWQRLVENNPQPIQIVQDGKIVFINQAGADLYGEEGPEKIIGVDVFTFSHPEARREIEERKRRLDAQEMIEPSEHKILRKNGEERYVEAHSIPIRYKGKNAIQSVIFDVTERKRQEEIIRGSLQEKEVLLQEIHHRVKNNLAVISGLLELQTMTTDHEAVTQLLKESQLRIHSMAMIHEKLYQSETLSDIGFDEYARELVETILNAFGLSEQNVEVQYDLEHISLNVNQAIPCALILNELIVNCYKHAFGDRQKGEVWVSMAQNKDMVQLSVEDKGVGLPEGFNLDDQQTLGMTLIKALSRQLYADCQIITRPEIEGTCFTLEFDLNRPL